ncbi:toprim domain-containing protein [Neobacillus sp. YIM B02564]|uniref:Toprim domain-containing protein n=1 Tax=Neobacillus paridis TaxID=2803862 RepID=A0ABS1TLE2_9BACI|nr:toprim domain-containing protein [Neobacillus paridis]
MRKPSVEELLLEQIVPEDFFEFMGWKLKRKGKDYRWRCPIHGGDGEYNYAYDPKTRNFHCYSRCGHIGNFVKAYQMAHQVSYEKALQDLAHWQGISLSGRRLRRPFAFTLEDKKVKEDLPASVKELPLVSAHEAKSLIPLLKHPRFSQASIERFQIKRCERGRYHHRIVFPIWDQEGRWVGNSGRWEGENFDKKGVPKYLYTAFPFEKSHVLYGYHLVLNSPFWILHEGVTDTIQAFEYGFGTVSVLGSSLSEEQIELIRKKPKPVIIGFDGDDAGRNAAKRAIQSLMDKHMPIDGIMVFPEGKDPGSVSKEEYVRIFTDRIHPIAFLRKFPS